MFSTRHLLFVLIGCSIFILCNSDNSTNIDKSQYYLAKVIGKGIDCGNTYLVEFLEKKEIVAQIIDSTGSVSASSGIYYGNGLKSEYQKDSLLLYIKFRQLTTGETGNCTTLGPGYQHVMITDILNTDGLAPVDALQSSPVLFSKTAINLAKGYRHAGWYIDQRGNIDTFSYKISDSIWLISEDSVFTQTEMTRLTANARSDNRKIDSCRLDTMVALAQGAAVGPFAVPENRCNDFGAITYSAFLYDSTVQGYREIVLFQAGDWTQKNESEAGRKLTRLLMSIDSMDIDEMPCAP